MHARRSPLYVYVLYIYIYMQVQYNIVYIDIDVCMHVSGTGMCMRVCVDQQYVYIQRAHSQQSQCWSHIALVSNSSYTYQRLTFVKKRTYGLTRNFCTVTASLSNKSFLNTTNPRQASYTYIPSPQNCPNYRPNNQCIFCVSDKSARLVRKLPKIRGNCSSHDRINEQHRQTASAGSRCRIPATNSVIQNKIR